ncbi:unnamed protein product, partial [marine sediment metagenome]
IRKPKKIQKRKSMSVRVLEKFIGPSLIILICLFPAYSLADEVRVNVLVAIIMHPPIEPDFGEPIEDLIFHGFRLADDNNKEKEKDV